ncbi:hypothetical protein DFH07DRAFT_960070 [Mycena maculata]|uniref:Chromo domain-containing protein n=1 Tax=Mycena maculata TaxID=230809 RepID=A0AAD7IZ41_9AGAR|nr:hypothetical protein DFH07DRAFT_960070 [Mycena maculata]
MQRRQRRQRGKQRRRQQRWRNTGKAGVVVVEAVVEGDLGDRGEAVVVVRVEGEGVDVDASEEEDPVEDTPGLLASDASAENDNELEKSDNELNHSDDDDGEETGIKGLNRHRWASGRHLEFQVVWTDGDVTWEPLSSVNDCTAMDEYLAHHDIDDPILLPKRKFLIDPTLIASNA